MIATITSIDWKDSEKTGIPYGIIKATAVQGDVNASILDEEDEDFINPLACMSRTFNLTKCIFPGTLEVAVAQQAAYVEGKKLRLGLFSVPIGKKFHIYNSDGELISDEKVITGVRDKAGIANGRPYKAGDTYETTELVPRVYENVSLILFVNKEGKSIENDGEDVEAIAARNFASGLAKGTYVLA